MESRKINAINTQNFYLNRYSDKISLIEAAPAQNLNLIVTIPAFAEPDAYFAINSLFEAQLPKCGVEVILLFNQPDNASNELNQQNLFSIQKVEELLNSKNLPFPVHVLKIFNLPKKHAGVGLARKIIMDEAVRRFELINNKNGIIVCFDADSEVSSNYFIEIENYFLQNPKIEAAGICFAHPFEKLANISPQRKAIVQYELHLRYYIQALKFAKHPHAFHTIGSSMAVKSITYQKVGGMNKRKAGEDFYFLQKIIPRGYFGEINKTSVFPSPRSSFRVPFGTGKAVGDFLQEEKHSFNSYDFETFKYLKLFFKDVEQFFYLEIDEIQKIIEEKNPMMFEFLINQNGFDGLQEVKRNTATLTNFFHRFFGWFNAFMCLKFVHFAENYFERKPVVSQAILLLKAINYSKFSEAITDEQLLLIFRKLDKQTKSDELI